MGIFDDKKSILDEIRTYNSIKDSSQVPDLDELNRFSTAKNNKEIMPFLVDLLTTLIGSLALESVVGEITTEYIPQAEEGLKSALKVHTATINSTSTLPSSFTSGLRVPVKTIDSYKLLNNVPGGVVGDLLYGGNVNSFDYKARTAIETPNTNITFGNLYIQYDDLTDEFIYTPVNPSDTIGSFTTTYIDNLDLLDEKKFFADVIDILFGTLKSQEGKTKSQLINEEKINATLQKIIDNEESFDLTEDDITEIENIALEKLNGVERFNVGCGFISSNVTTDSLNDLVNTITGSTDPLTVGNKFADTLIDGFEPDDSDVSENENAIKDGFFKRLIKAIIFALVKAITATPQIRTLFAFIELFKNNLVDLGDPVDDLKNKSDLIDCLSKDATAKIHEFVFNIIRRAIRELIIPVSKYILKEKINSYLRIIRSLIPFNI